MNDLEKQVQAEFAEAQLQVSSDDKTDFAYQIDNLNQEDVFNYYQTQGFDREDAESEINGIDFEDRVRHENIEVGDEFSRHRESRSGDENYTSIHPTGNYLAQSDANPENLGIPSKDIYNVTESYQATEDTTALVSTAKDIESWRSEEKGKNVIFQGGETQYYVATEDLDNFQKTNQFSLNEPPTFSNSIDRQDNNSINNPVESMSTQFTEPGKQPEQSPATIEDSNNSNDSSDDNSTSDEFGMPSHNEDGDSFRDDYFNEINSDNSDNSTNDRNTFDELAMPSHDEDGNSFRDDYFNEINSDNSDDSSPNDSSPDDGSCGDDV